MTRECSVCGGGGGIHPSQELGYYGTCQTCDGSGWVVVEGFDGPMVRPATSEFDEELDPMVLDWLWDDD